MLGADTLPVLPGRQPFVLLKHFGEVAAFGEAGVQAYGSDGQSGTVQKVGRLLDTEEIHIVYRRLVSDRPEDPAEVFGVHAGDGGQLFQCQILPVMVFDKFQHGFYLLHAVIGRKILVLCRGVKMLFQDPCE